MRIANLDTSFAVTNEGATGAAKARQGAAMAAAGCGAQKTKVPFVGKTVGTGHSEATVSVRRKDVTKY